MSKRKEIKKPWEQKEISTNDLAYLGFKEIDPLAVKRNFVENKNILVKFFYHDMHLKKLVESPLYLLDKDILKDKNIPKYTAFEFLFQKLKMQEVFPHSIMSTFIYTDHRTKTPKGFIKEKIVPLNENQSFFNFS